MTEKEKGSETLNCASKRGAGTFFFSYNGITMNKNVLLITADQLRADVLGCYGDPVCQTPAIDNLARSGVLFENAFTPNPICVPARACITTGNYPHHATGTKNNAGRIGDDQPKIAQHFADAGYRTFACGKLHYAPYSRPGEPRLVHGFHHWDSCEEGRMAKMDESRSPDGPMRGLEDYSDYLADVGWGGYSRAHGVGNNSPRPCPTPLPTELHVDHWVADCTIDRLKQHNASSNKAPFLIWCSFIKPHAPLDPPIEYVQMYDPREIPKPFGDETMLADRNPQLQINRQRLAYDSMSPAARQVAKAHYYGLVSFQDAQIARIIETLRQLGQLEDTIIVYTADHGDLIGDFGMFAKCNFLRGSVNVPLIIAGPGVPHDQRRKQLTGLQDVLPTVTSLAGCALGREVDGCDLTEALHDPEAPVREVYYSQCFDHPRQSAMVTDGDWKYCYSQRGPTEELYNLRDDPTELQNLAANSSCAVKLEHWRDVLIREATRLGDTAIVDESTSTGLAEAQFDRSEIAQLPITGMGWTWY